MWWTGDGVVDLAVGASADGDGGTGHGAVWILFLTTAGTVKGRQKISSTAGEFTGELDYIDAFGVSVACLGDMDGDGQGLTHRALPTPCAFPRVHC